jgi:hypothetical protein
MIRQAEGRHGAVIRQRSRRQRREFVAHQQAEEQRQIQQ